MPLPTFLVIGAMKAGTSSLYRYLVQHPAIPAATKKELDFFNKHYDRGLDWYRRQFGDGVAGEASPNYLKAHLRPEVAARIHHHLPDVRMVCVLRDPVDRALSHYLHNVGKGRLTKPFSEAATANGNIVTSSKYGWQLDHFFRYFADEQIMLLTTDEFDRSPVEVTRRVWRFIGVDDSFTPDTSQRHNVTAQKLAQQEAQVPPDPSGLATRDDGRLAPTPQMREKLAAEFREDLARLQAARPDFTHQWEL